MRHILILTDFDGKLTKRDTFPMFLRFAGGNRFWCMLPAIAWHVVLLKMGLTSAQQTKEAILSCFFKGWSREKLHATGKQFISGLLEREKTFFRSGALEMIRESRKNGERIIIVSASPEEWIAPFAAAFGIEYIATRLEYSERGFTGKIADKNCNGEEKVRRVKKLIHGLDSYIIYAYGDSTSDLPMLALASKKFYRPFCG